MSDFKILSYRNGYLKIEFQDIDAMADYLMQLAKLGSMDIYSMHLHGAGREELLENFDVLEKNMEKVHKDLNDIKPGFLKETGYELEFEPGSKYYIGISGTRKADHYREEEFFKIFLDECIKAEIQNEQHNPFPDGSPKPNFAVFGRQLVNYSGYSPKDYRFFLTLHELYEKDVHPVNRDPIASDDRVTKKLIEMGKRYAWEQELHNSDIFREAIEQIENDNLKPATEREVEVLSGKIREKYGLRPELRMA